MADAPGGAWPHAWRTHRRYLPWRARRRANGGTGKVPQGGMGSRLQPVDPLDPTHWLTWGSAWAVVQAGDADGIGLAVTPELHVTVVDLDRCLDRVGDPDHLAQEVLQTFAAAYAERSPSGTGLHVLLRAACPPGWRRRPGIEIIDRGFATITGDQYRVADDPLPDHTVALSTWHQARQPRPIPRSAVLSSVHDPDDATLIRRAHAARNGARFGALWSGGLAGCASASEADYTLLLMLAYWFGSGTTTADLDRLFRQSGRMRGKWAVQGHLTPYARRTLAAVLSVRRA